MYGLDSDTAGRRRSLCTGLLAVLLAAGMTAAGASQGGLSHLAVAVGQAAETERAGFAAAALSELTAAHTEEADRARSEARHDRRDRDLLRWANAASAYALELQRLGESLASATTVEVGAGIGPEQIAYLRIDGRLVMVSSPRPRHQAGFEQRVIERFCAGYPCDDYLAAYQPPPARLQPVVSQPRWSFSQYSGPACSTEDGLVFQFRNTTDLDRKRRACKRIVADLNALAMQLARDSAAGIRIDWNRVSVLPGPGPDRQIVTLNGDGDTAMLSLPALVHATDLFRQLRPWLAARLQGERYRLVLINSDRLLAPLIGSDMD